MEHINITLKMKYISEFFNVKKNIVLLIQGWKYFGIFTREDILDIKFKAIYFIEALIDFKEVIDRNCLHFNRVAFLKF